MENEAVAKTQRVCYSPIARFIYSYEYILSRDMMYAASSAKLSVDTGFDVCIVILFSRVGRFGILLHCLKFVFFDHFYELSQHFQLVQAHS